MKSCIELVGNTQQTVALLGCWLKKLTSVILLIEPSKQICLFFKSFGLYIVYGSTAAQKTH